MRRYQDCNWPVRLWRRRHQLRIPFVAISIWRYEQKRDLDDEDDWRMTFGQCWGLAIGLSGCFRGLWCRIVRVCTSAAWRSRSWGCRGGWPQDEFGIGLGLPGQAAPNVLLPLAVGPCVQRDEIRGPCFDR